MARGHPKSIFFIQRPQNKRDGVLRARIGVVHVMNDDRNGCAAVQDSGNSLRGDLLLWDMNGGIFTGHRHLRPDPVQHWQFSASQCHTLDRSALTKQLRQDADPRTVWLGRVTSAHDGRIALSVPVPSCGRDVP